MKHAQLLPKSYRQRYQGWKASDFPNNQALFARLVDGGQHPRAMVIACCDSRVNISSVFGAEVGEFFMHRNIANIVPPYDTSKENHGTSAAIQYAVTALGVAHIFVIGHTQCGGVKGCHAKCSGQAPELEADDSFVGKWVETLRPGYEVVAAQGGDDDTQVAALERQGVLVSLDNLMSFPFVADRVKKGELSLHGMVLDIRDGHMDCYDPEADGFVRL